MFEMHHTGLLKQLVPMESFRPFPKYEDRAGWESLREELRTHMIQKGEEYLGYGWPTPLASLYMDFARNGNRSRYEYRVFTERRLPLLHLVVAECCEGKGRFIDDIINGVWTTLDEATWIIPCHNYMFALKGDSPTLPDTEDPDGIDIDLFSAECAAVIAWVYYLLGDRLGQEVPQVPARMLGEVHRRILRPFMLHDLPWMGLGGEIVDNWNPWILSNVMTVAVLACKDEQLRAAVLEKSMVSLESFVRYYTPDGGCDEGPTYWGAAGAALFDALDVLCDVTDGQVDYLKADLIRNICAYIYKVQINDRYFVNYADAVCRFDPVASIIYRMGKRTGDENLVKMGARLFKDQNARGGANWELDGCGCHVYRTTKMLFVDRELAEEADADYPYARDVWFPGIQVMAARVEEGSVHGLYLSAKAGHNDECHNHNDVGSFVIYCDGKPVVIDIGTAVYVKDTFTDRRYTIKQMQSLYHNLPIIGGRGQKEGRSFAARNVEYSLTETFATLKEDIAGAYEPDVGVNTWQRTFTFDRANAAVTVADAFELAEEKDVQLVLITAKEPAFAGNEMTVTLDEETAVTMTFDPTVRHTTELFPTGHDANLTRSWGEDGVYRTLFTLPVSGKTGGNSFVFRKK